MNGFEKLLECCGEWAGRNRVQPAVGDPIDESISRLTIVPVLNETFVRMDQQWSWEQKPQLGSLLIGYVPAKEEASIHWIDTWHNGRKCMNLMGRFELEGRLVAHGSFGVESGPDWGWRIEIDHGPQKLSINMFCTNPCNGKEEGWVWSEFARL